MERHGGPNAERWEFVFTLYTFVLFKFYFLKQTCIFYNKTH